MESQRNDLLKALPERGWEIAEIEHAPLDWWTDEVWTVESRWSPVGFRLFIIFLVDPQSDVDRRKGQSVWEVSAAVEMPTDRVAAGEGPVAGLSPKWKENLARYLDDLDAIRTGTWNPMSKYVC
jgi:hypothetical protein